ncbi:hypothetical protein JCM5350_007710 [Sporobolomyces pararoseus]
MPRSRRSLSVPPQSQPTPASTFDDPTLHSSQPATPVYGRHTGLEGYVPEGFLHPLPETVGRKSPTNEIILQLKQVKVSSNAQENPSVMITAASPFSSPPQPNRSAPISFPNFPLVSPSSPSSPPAVAPPLADSDDHTSSPPSPTVSLPAPSLELYDPNPINPKALPLPSPPLEGDYIFPDPVGRASLLAPSTSSRRHYPEPQAQPSLPENLPDSPSPSQAALFFPLSKSPDIYSSDAQPSAPRLEPLRNFAPSPPSGRLSAFTGSPHPVSPNFELEGPMFENWTPAPIPSPLITKNPQGGGQRYGGIGGRTAARGGGNGRRGHQSPSPLRGIGTKARDLELEKAKERIRELEREVDALRRELLESQTQQIMNLSMK